MEVLRIEVLRIEVSCDPGRQFTFALGTTAPLYCQPMSLTELELLANCNANVNVPLRNKMAQFTVLPYEGVIILIIS